MKIALFDIGNVLVNFDINVLYRKMSMDTSYSIDEIKAITNAKHTRLLETGKISMSEYMIYYRETIDLQWDEETWIKKYSEIYSKNKIGAELRKKLLRRGNPVCLLSNLAEYNKRALELFCPEILIGNTKNFYSYELGIHKPSHTIYLKVLDILGVRAEECIFIDDQKENIDGAIQVGMTGLQFVNSNYKTIYRLLEI